MNEFIYKIHTFTTSIFYMSFIKHTNPLEIKKKKKIGKDEMFKTFYLLIILKPLSSLPPGVQASQFENCSSGVPLAILNYMTVIYSSGLSFQ